MIPDDWHDFVLVAVVLVATVLLYALVDPLGGGPRQVTGRLMVRRHHYGRLDCRHLARMTAAAGSGARQAILLACGEASEGCRAEARRRRSR